ncbi:hypothetical protein [Trueperella pyogenes]|uniref:hypothetical protein n=1 Tax=Trueperella pyogenes TaxID=1661 RepID=UPI00345DEB47
MNVAIAARQSSVTIKLFDARSARMRETRTVAALNILPACFMLGLLFVAAILAVVASAPAIAFLTGVAAVVLVVVFAFVDLHARLNA